MDVGANLFIGNLDENVDERLLYDTFSAFGVMATTAKVRHESVIYLASIDMVRNYKIARDPSTGKSKGYGFVSFTDFESSDAAIESMNGQFLMNKAITVQYAFKKDGKGERHGTPAERLLAAQARKNNALPVSARPPPAPIAFGSRPPMPGYQGPYQGQFAGALAAQPPPPPPGFAPQQAMVPQHMPMQMGGMPPPGMSMGMPPPPPNMPVYQPQPGFAPPPPPPGFMPQGMPGMPMMPPPPPGMPQQAYMG